MTLLALILYICCNSIALPWNKQSININQNHKDKDITKEEDEISYDDVEFTNVEKKSLDCSDVKICSLLDIRVGVMSNDITKSCFLFNNIYMYLAFSPCDKLGFFARLDLFYGDAPLYRYNDKESKLIGNNTKNIDYDNSNNMISVSSASIDVRSIGKMKGKDDIIKLSPIPSSPLQEIIPILTDNIYINLNNLYGIQMWGVRSFIGIHKNICFSRIRPDMPYVPHTKNNINIGLTCCLLADKFSPLNLPDGFLNNRFWHLTTTKEVNLGIVFSWKIITRQMLLNPSILLLFPVYTKTRISGTEYGLYIKKGTAITGSNMTPPTSSTDKRIYEEDYADIKYFDVSGKFTPLILSDIRISLHISSNLYCGLSFFLEYKGRTTKSNKNIEDETTKSMFNIQMGTCAGIGLGVYYGL